MPFSFERILPPITLSSSTDFPYSRKFPVMRYGLLRSVPTVTPTSSSSVWILRQVILSVVYSSHRILLYSASVSDAPDSLVMSCDVPLELVGYNPTCGYKPMCGYKPIECISGRYITSKLPLRSIRPKPAFTVQIALSAVVPVRLPAVGAMVFSTSISSLTSACVLNGIPKCCNSDSLIALSFTVPYSTTFTVTSLPSCSFVTLFSSAGKRALYHSETSTDAPYKASYATTFL